jgi:type I restriction-modification system DNA methylase subunit/restriction endonuclease S subunit
MLNLKTYSCGICKTSPDQISHHKSHIETQKHKDKKELFELKLTNLSEVELENKYKTSNICDIVYEIENIIYKPLSSIKKLNSNNQDMIYDTITKEMSNMIEQSNNISNKEALRDKIHEIHNFLRNNGAGYGMNALKVFNILYGLKRIEEKGLNDKAGLSSDCKFSYLLELARIGEGEKLSEVILGGCLTSIAGSNIRDLLFYEIPQNIKGKVFCHLVKEIESITIIEKTCNVLLSGKIYEYFIGRDATAISELGAYFTDRHIIEYILRKLNPLVNEDGSIYSMIDMFGGSGGFTTGYINYLIENDTDKSIKWETEINKIYHFDMNEDVIKSAGLEFFCLTGQFPDMRNNVSYRNSFTSEFGGDDNKPRKYKYVLTNPPYGGDKNQKSEIQLKREKIKDYIKTELATNTDEGLRIKRQKQLKSIEALEKTEKKESDKTKVCIESCSGRIQKFAYINKLKSNDKEGCSLQLLMDMVEIGGTVIGVLKEGVFFNKTYKDLRKHLIENFNVREVISVPSDQFENTSTKTSIIIFDNDENGKTTCDIKFSDLVIERFEEDKFLEIGGELCIVENKGDIVRVGDALVSNASISELIGNTICSLNGKDYNKKEIVVGEGYELVKLGDICEFLPKSKRNASFGSITGQYNFYTSSDKVQKCDVADYNEECLIIGSGGVANIKIDNCFSCSADNLLLKSTNNYYLYSLLKGNMNMLSDGFSGSVLKHLSKTYLKNIQIPIPKSQSKIQEWVDKISVPYNEKNEKKTQIKELEIFVQNRIKEIGYNEECEEVELMNVCKFINGKKRKTTDGKTTGLYPLFSSSLIVDNWINTNDYNEECIVINTINGSGKFNLQHSNKFCATSNTIIFNTENVILTIYIYYFGLINIETISNLANGSTKKKMGKAEISKFKLKLPKNKQLIQDLEPVFQQIEALQNDAKLAEQLYKQYIQELSNEAIPNSQHLTTQLQENDTEEIQTQDQENEIEPEPETEPVIPKKIKKTVKKTKSVITNDKEQEQDKEPEILQETKSENVQVQEQEPVLVPKKIKKIVKKLKLVITEQEQEKEQEI